MTSNSVQAHGFSVAALGNAKLEAIWRMPQSWAGNVLVHAMGSHSLTALDSCASEKIHHAHSSRRLVLRKLAVKGVCRLANVEDATFGGKSAISRSQLMMVLMLSLVKPVVFFLEYIVVWNTRTLSVD